MLLIRLKQHRDLYTNKQNTCIIKICIFSSFKNNFQYFFSNTLQTQNTNLSIKQCLKTFQVLNKENGNNDLRYFTHIPIKHLINFFKKLNIYFKHPTFPSMHFYCVKLRRWINHISFFYILVHQCMSISLVTTVN